MHKISEFTAGHPRLMRGLGTATIFLCCLCMSITAYTYANTRMYGDDVGPITLLSFLANVVGAVLLCRYRTSEHLPKVAWLLALIAIVAPTDALGALIALGYVITRYRSMPLRVITTVLVFAGVWATLWRDGQGTTEKTSQWNPVTHSGKVAPWPPMSPGIVTAFALVFTTIAVLIGQVCHARYAVRREHKRAVHATRQLHELDIQLAQREHQDAVAREVHDVLGHRLSLLAMQAGALEAEAEVEGNKALQERAEQIQTGAAGSMKDLRSLLDLLRNHNPDAASHAPKINDIAQIVRECIEAGTPVSSNVFIDQGELLDPAIAHAAIRITTELLTNARKHSPGELVYLSVEGSPAQGLTITTTNPVLSLVHNSRGLGLGGIKTRAEQVGGTFSFGITDRFETHTHLPWRLR